MDKRNEIKKHIECKTLPGPIHPTLGMFFPVEFEDGSFGVILKPKGRDFEPLCKLPEGKDKAYPTLEEAIEVLYESISVYGIPKYQEKLFCYELIGQSFDNEDIKPLNLPVHPPYYRQMHAVGVYELKKAVYAYCCGVEEEEKSKFKEDAIIPERLPIWQAFKKNGFDFYKFMVEKDYELIEDEEMRVEVLMGTCFPILNLPIGKFAIDWLNGYLDFFKRKTEEFTDTEVLCQLFFCSTEEDIWKLMATGIGDIACLYHWYKGEYFNPILKEATGIPCHFEKDEQKASDFLDYLMSDSTGATESVRNEAMVWKKMTEDIDMLREITGDLKRTE